MNISQFFRKKPYSDKSFEKRKKENGKSSAPTTPHLASPEVIINEKTKQIHLYYHGILDGSLQKSKIALSKDGINFEAQPEIISLPYLRVFSFRGKFYDIAMSGFLYQTKDGISNFEVRKRWLFDTNVRQTGLCLKGNDLYIFYTQVGDQSEQILYNKMDMASTDWNDCKVEPAKALLQPKLEWEGANLPKEISMRGEIGVPVNQLRGPDIFEDKNGDLYLLYSGGGE